MQQSTAPEIAPEVFHELNQLFYRSEPDRHLNATWEQLIVRAAGQRPNPESVKLGSLHVTTQSRTQEEHLADVSLEAVIHLHHSAETLFRLMWAHLEKPACPWLGVAETSAPVKQKLRRVADGSEPSGGDLRTAFLGDKPNEVSSDEWVVICDEAMAGYKMLLTWLAHILTTEAAFYNGAKHGMVAMIHDLGQSTFDGHRGISGAGLINLRRQLGLPKSVPEAKRWFIDSRTLDLEARLALAAHTHAAIRDVMTVGRRRLLGAEGRISPPSEHAIQASLMAGPDKPGQRWQVAEFSMPSKAAGASWNEGLLPTEIRLSGLSPAEEAVNSAREWLDGDQLPRTIALDENESPMSRPLPPNQWLLPFGQ